MSDSKRDSSQDVLHAIDLNEEPSVPPQHSVQVVAPAAGCPSWMGGSVWRCGSRRCRRHADCSEGPNLLREFRADRDTPKRRAVNESLPTRLCVAIHVNHQRRFAAPSSQPPCLELLYFISGPVHRAEPPSLHGRARDDVQRRPIAPRRRRRQGTNNKQTANKTPAKTFKAMKHNAYLLPLRQEINSVILRPRRINLNAPRGGLQRYEPRQPNSANTQALGSFSDSRQLTSTPRLSD